jgi:hypothetical protein
MKVPEYSQLTLSGPVLSAENEIDYTICPISLIISLSSSFCCNLEGSEPTPF